MLDSHQLRLRSGILVFAAIGFAFGSTFAQDPGSTPGLQSSNSSSASLPAVLQTFSNHSAPEEVGDAYMVHRQYQAALEAYKQANQSSSDVWNKLGIANQMMLDLRDARRCYQESIKLNPSNVNALNNLGTVYDALEQPGNAVREYHKAILIDPNSALIYKNLGTSLLSQHQYEKGWEAYKTAISMDPQIFTKKSGLQFQKPGSVSDRGAFNYYMARGCVRSGLIDRAIDYLRMALNEGYTNRKKIVADTEFAGLRGNPAFDRLLDAQGPR